MSPLKFVRNHVRTCHVALVLVSSLELSTASAQSTTVPITANTRSVSTAGQSQTQALADLLRGRAQADLLSTQAAEVAENVRRSHIENELLTVQTRLEIRRLAEEEAAHKALLRQQRRDRLARLASVPNYRRPNATDLDPVTGEITWPIVLATDEYKRRREEIQTAFKHRAEEGRVPADEYQSLQKSLQKTQSALRTHLRDYITADYVEGHALLKKLTYESRLPVDHFPRGNFDPRLAMTK